MNAHPTLSIITVNLNNREGLQRTIDSVVGQTFTDYEWIVIDGDSTDGSRELIEQYADHFAYWCSEPDKGIYNAMNKGIAHAKGEWLQFLNSGDWLYEDTTLEKVFSKEYEADVLYGDLILRLKNDKIAYRNYPDKLNIKFFYDHALGHQASFYNFSIFINNDYNENHKIVSDWEFTLKLYSENHKFYHIPIYIAVFTTDGISSTLEDENIKERKRVLLNYVPSYFKQDVDINIKAKNKELLIHNHKLLQYIAKRQERRLLFIAKIINAIEQFRIK